MNARIQTETPRPSSSIDGEALRHSATTVLRTEARAIEALCGRINGQFLAACELILNCRGRIVLSGMGKSGHIANKVAATLASTGTPAFFVHPGEASHGDMGMILADDVVLAISNSGETDELLTILPVLKRKGIALIVMSGNEGSSLGRLADVHIDVSVSEEACPLGLAPTASTTAALAMGDALAIALLESRGFTADDFARSHPAGSLGRRLLLRISDVMHQGADLPTVASTASVFDALMEMTKQGLGMTAVVDAERHLLGVFTDGDLRRAVDAAPIDLRQTAVTLVMSAHPKTISPDQLAVEAARMMEDFKVHALLVTDEANVLVGALNIHDLLRARVV